METERSHHRWGHGKGNASNQLDAPNGLYVDDDQTVSITDCLNHRIVKWKSGATRGEVVAGGNEAGNRTDQLSCPTDVIVNKQTDSLIICDRWNRRVMRWSRRNGTSGETIIKNIACTGLTMDDQRFLYVSDKEKCEVRRYRVRETNGTVVAGGNGKDDRLNQLNVPYYVFVDRDYSVYVSDVINCRVMKWAKGAKEGIVVAGGRGRRDVKIKLSNPRGLFADQLGALCVADLIKHRVTRWYNGPTQRKVIVGGNGTGQQVNQLRAPVDLSSDGQGNLYVADGTNNRVQRLSIE